MHKQQRRRAAYTSMTVGEVASTTVFVPAFTKMKSQTSGEEQKQKAA